VLIYAGTDDVDDEAVRIIAGNSLISKATRVAQTVEVG